MRQFFKIMFASMLGSGIAFAILMFTGFVVIAAMIASMIASIGSTAEVYIPDGSQRVLKIELAGELRETADDNLLGSLLGKEPALSLKNILDAINMAKEMETIDGIYLDASYLLAGTASIDAIRRALIDFRESDKFVVAYADNYTQGCYHLASAADQVFLNPQGALLLTGKATQPLFYTGILKKIGVEMMVFKVGTYKGAVEPFMLDKLSDENRAQITSYQQGVWNRIVGDISSARSIGVEKVNEFADKGLAMAGADNAVEYGLIDELSYREEAENYVKKLVGADADKKLKTVSATQLASLKIEKRKKTDGVVAVVYAEGEIVEAESSMHGKYITEKFADELKRLKNNKKINAVVLRVNSPGGSGYTSEQIWKQVNDLASEKKIVVSMGNVAASGGYYISCAANKIVAEANTLTGSIGVFGIFPNMAGLFGKLDLTSDVVKTNVYADLGDPSRPMRSDEKALIQNYVERFYDVFLTRCSDGREMTKEEVDRIGQGRVWTGEQALENGLVDELGGLDRAIEIAAELAGLDNYRIQTIDGASDPFMERLMKQMGNVKQSAVEEALGDDAQLFRSLQQIRRTRGIQARLPYDLENL